MKNINLIPNAIVSVDTVGDLINQLRGEIDANSGQREVNEADANADTATTQPGKKSVIPKAIVSENSELDELRNLLTSGRELEIDSGGRIIAAGSTPNNDASESASSAEGKAKTIPKAIVSAPQWYETNKDLYNAEVAAMRREFNDPTLEPKFMNDGRTY